MCALCVDLFDFFFCFFRRHCRLVLAVYLSSVDSLSISRLPSTKWDKIANDVNGGNKRILSRLRKQCTHRTFYISLSLFICLIKNNTQNDLCMRRRFGKHNSTHTCMTFGGFFFRHNLKRWDILNQTIQQQKKLYVIQDTHFVHITVHCWLYSRCTNYKISYT